MHARGHRGREAPGHGGDEKPLKGAILSIFDSFSTHFQSFFDPFSISIRDFRAMSCQEHRLL